MKSIIGWLAALATAPLAAEPLSQADRQALAEALETLRSEATNHASSRLRDASTDFSAALKSKEAATELYIRCVEKVDFIDRDRKASEFRAWKKRSDDRLDDEGHALALQHQLQWTVLAMQAATDREKKHELADQALEALEAIYRTPKELTNYVGVLAQSVGSTVFARAYDLTGYKVEGWPMTPLQTGAGGVRVDGPFEELILPAYRRAKDPERLRAAWLRRIHFDEIAKGFWSRDSTEEGESSARDYFLAESRPVLVWEMEEDLFKAGDEKRAARALVDHLKENIRHSKARDWEARFRALISPSPVSDAGDTVDAGS